MKRYQYFLWFLEKLLWIVITIVWLFAPIIIGDSVGEYIQKIQHNSKHTLFSIIYSCFLSVATLIWYPTTFLIKKNGEHLLKNRDFFRPFLCILILGGIAPFLSMFGLVPLDHFLATACFMIFIMTGLIVDHLQLKNKNPSFEEDN
jgi:hypothetical protein